VRGQVIHLNLDMKPARYQEATTVVMQPPIKPSHVFLGESCINFLCPKHIPAAKPLSKFGKSHRRATDDGMFQTVEVQYTCTI